MNNKETKELISDCAAYFKSKKAYHRVFYQMNRNWRKYGKSSGYIQLNQATLDEQQELGGFLGKNFYEGTIRFHMSVFEQALLLTRFKEITLKELLEAYFGGELITNKDRKEKADAKKRDFFQSLYEQVEKVFGSGSPSAEWLQEMIVQRRYGYQILCGEAFYSEKETAKKAVWHVCQALEILEKQTTTIRLALLGAKITLNPHAFDRGTTEGKLLIQALSCKYRIAEIQSGEDIFMLYHKAGIRPDDISSFTTAYGISLYIDEKEHMAYRSFIYNKEPYVITLSNLSRINKADSKDKQVYVIENQMVFSHMCEELADTEVSLLCTSGQIKTASFILIDLLCESGCKILYNGDFDPEGLNIADKVLGRNKNCIVPWHMGKEDYYNALSNEILSTERLLKLQSIKDSRLFDVKNAILCEKRAGYQEQLINLMLEEIQGIYC